jgi:sulfide:quinone oxidoreductase
MEPELELYEVSEEVALAGQIGPDAIPFIAEQGFRGIICSRFDGEEEGQPDFPSVERAAAAHGIKTAYMPVLQPPLPISNEEAFTFGDILETLPKPVLAYCRTGSRVAILWALSEARRRPFKEVVLAAMGAGYDLTSLTSRFQQLYKPGP